jgi:hypothetical protein
MKNSVFWGVLSCSPLKGRQQAELIGCLFLDLEDENHVSLKRRLTSGTVHSHRCENVNSTMPRTGVNVLDLIAAILHCNFVSVRISYKWNLRHRSSNLLLEMSTQITNQPIVSSCMTLLFCHYMKSSLSVLLTWCKGRGREVTLTCVCSSFSLRSERCL